MSRVRLLSWWYWPATGLRLAAPLGGCPLGFAPVIGLTLFQTLYYVLREGSARAFPVQVRLGDLGGLLAGLWGPLAFFHRIRLDGTAAPVVADDCPMARIVLLPPWNRRTPLSSPADHHPGCRYEGRPSAPICRPLPRALVAEKRTAILGFNSSRRVDR